MTVPDPDESVPGFAAAQGRQRTPAEIERLASIVLEAEDAILAKTTDGVIVEWNRGAEKVYGYSATEAIGRSVTMLFRPEIAEREVRVTERVPRGARIQHHDHRQVGN